MLSDELQAILEVLWEIAPPKVDARFELEGCGLGPARIPDAHCRVLTTFGRLIIELSDETGFPHHVILAQYDKRLVTHLMPGAGEYRTVRRWRNRPAYARHALGTQQIEGLELNHVRIVCRNRPPVPMDADCWLDSDGAPRAIHFWLRNPPQRADAQGDAMPYDIWSTVDVFHEPVDKQLFEIPTSFVATNVGTGDIYNAGKLMSGWKMLNKRIRS